VIIVASVSCIYGLGSPSEYAEHLVAIERGQKLERDEVLRALVNINYNRNDFEFGRGTFRVRGDVVDIHPAYDDIIIRIELFGDEVESVSRVDQVTGKKLEGIDKINIFPATHFVTPPDKIEEICLQIEKDLKDRLRVLRDENKLVEAQRLESRTNYDVEMIREIGYCSGIENYSRYFDGRAPGTPPFTLLDHFPEDFICFLDESHATVPQLNGMYNGDRSRKEMLVNYGFRLPAALDNRPLKFEEFNLRVRTRVFVSATPAEYELEQSRGVVAEQLVRPTGLVDPGVEVYPVGGQVDHLIDRIRERLEKKERVMVTTLTKKMAEDLTEYLGKLGLPVRYLHSEVDTLERAEIIRNFRQGQFEVLVGINLLREGLDLPEVSLVAILDADKEGFLRSERSLIQTMGRASRNINGTVILYADNMTQSIRKAIDETSRRRQKQEAYNREHNIVPRTIIRRLEAPLSLQPVKTSKKEKPYLLENDTDYLIDLMNHAAANLEFEKAAEIRDRIQTLKEEQKKKDA
jgi:excinuclease ABC subunit B